MTVTVLLPFHREKEWLDEAIRSLADQTYRDVELILIDSHSDEKTRSIAEKWITKDSRCTLTDSTKPGLVAALNTGIMNSHGTFIARMDADDIAHPQRIEKQVDYLQTHPDISVVGTQTEVFPATSANEGFRWFVEWQNRLVTPADHFLNRFIEAPVAHPSVMMRRALFERWGMYSEEPVPEDYELWLRWMSQGVYFAKLEEKLLQWRDRPQRLTRSDPHYAEEAFWQVKLKYLIPVLLEVQSRFCRVVVCGGSKHIRRKTEELLQRGIRVDAVTDVTDRPSSLLPFLPAQTLMNDGDTFVINLIGKRDARQPIRQFLISQGFQEGESFLMCGG